MYRSLQKEENTVTWPGSGGEILCWGKGGTGFPHSLQNLA